MSEKVAIIGAGKTALLASEIFRENGVEVIGFFIEQDYLGAKKPSSLNGPVEDMNTLEQSLLRNPGTGFFVAVGYQNLNQERQRLASLVLGTNSPQLTCISKAARISKTASLRPGVLVGPFVDVQFDAVVAEGTFLWSNVTIGHGAHVERYCWVAAGSSIGGDARIGESSFLGLNAVVGHNVVIGGSCLVGSGVSVTRNLEPGAAALNGTTQVFSRGAQRLSRASGL